MHLNHDQRSAVRMLKTGRSFCVYGAAGTGKSVVRRRIAELVPSVTLGPTGMSIADSKGMTVARFLKATPRSIACAGTMARSMTAFPNVPGFTIIIDEAPMVATAQLLALDAGAKRVRRSHLPFGGVRVVILGDFCQLAAPGAVTPLFDAAPIRALAPDVVTLVQQMRQGDEPALAALLHDCRRCRLSQASADLLLTLNRRTPRPDAVRLYATRAEAAAHNRTRLRAHPGKAFTHNNVTLKIGVPVCVTGNIYRGGSLWLANGARGTVVALSATVVTVDVGGVLRPMITPAPLELGFAITVHRAQGQTYSHVTVVGTRFFAPGQLYTALSRVTGLEGLCCIDVLPEHAEIPHPVRVREYLAAHG